MTHRLARTVAAIAATLCFAVAGCGSGEEREPAAALRARVSGSNVTLPLVRLLAHEYPDRSVEFEFLPGLHTAGGVQGVAGGELDIGLVSRELTDEERALGLRYVLLSNDALVVAVHPTVGVKTLTSEQVRGIYSGRYRSWQELGGPDLPIVVLDRNEDESAKIALRAHVLGHSLEVTSAAAVLSHEPDMIAAVASTPGAIGYFSLGAAVSQNVAVDLIALDGVAPTVENVKSGRYRAVRPLGVVTRPDSAPAIERFLEWAVGPEGRAVMERNGYAAAR